tara:strand:+ start:56 stop:352 length:297 start_codon:yes stop_codon:yes gene_type:complete
MKLSELASKPQLQEILIEDKELVEKYGDKLSFYIQDRLPIETYTKLATVKTDDAGQMYNIVKDLILDEDGIPVMVDGNVLPIDVMTAAVEKVAQSLGK